MSNNIVIHLKVRAEKEQCTEFSTEQKDRLYNQSQVCELRL